MFITHNLPRLGLNKTLKWIVKSLSGATTGCMVRSFGISIVVQFSVASLCSGCWVNRTEDIDHSRGT